MTEIKNKMNNYGNWFISQYSKIIEIEFDLPKENVVYEEDGHYCI